MDECSSVGCRPTLQPVRVLDSTIMFKLRGMLKSEFDRRKQELKEGTMTEEAE